MPRSCRKFWPKRFLGRKRPWFKRSLVVWMRVPRGQGVTTINSSGKERGRTSCRADIRERARFLAVIIAAFVPVRQCGRAAAGHGVKLRLRARRSPSTTPKDDFVRFKSLEAGGAQTARPEAARASGATLASPLKIKRVAPIASTAVCARGRVPPRLTRPSTTTRAARCATTAPRTRPDEGLRRARIP
jgi:hypothetical protein